MKIQKIVSLCKESGQMYITKMEDAQWVGNGQAVYPLYGLPEFTPETLCETFGLSEDQQSKMILNEKTVEEYQGINFDMLNGKEEPVEVMKIGLLFGGTQLIALKHGGGISFIKRKYMSPFDEETQIWRRVGKAGEYFVIAGGMFTKGIILPETGTRADIAAEIKEITENL